VVAIAASAGGVEALRALVGALPAGFPAAVLVVLHIPPTGPTLLPQILSRAGKLPARHPQDGEDLSCGVILVAPPDRHLAVSGGQVRLLAGPRENGHRPSGDILLRSVAENCRTRCSGVVLSGTMDDGAAGLAAVRAVGGLALVQDPAEAAFPSMPMAAIEEADPQFVGPVTALADRLGSWASELGQEVTGARPASEFGDDPELTPFTCFECGGALWLRDDYGVQRLRCRVGHTFSVDSLLLDKHTALERALWAAVAVLQERADLSRRIIKQLERTGRADRADRYRNDIAVAEGQTKLLREVIGDLVKNGSSAPTYHAGVADGDPA
jgi:two-component system, chemotaxis family, protein-glutamate methylesterase/glutaminase